MILLLEVSKLVFKDLTSVLKFLIKDSLSAILFTKSKFVLIALTKLSNLSLIVFGLFFCMDTIILRSFKIFSNLCFNKVIWLLYTFIKDSILTEDLITVSFKFCSWFPDISAHSAIFCFKSSFSLFKSWTFFCISSNFFSCSSNCILHLFSNSIFSSNNFEYSSSFLFKSLIKMLFSLCKSFNLDWYSSLFFSFSILFSSNFWLILLFSLLALFISSSKFCDFTFKFLLQSSNWDKRKFIVWFFSFISKFILSKFFDFSIIGSNSFIFCCKTLISLSFCFNCDK